MNKELKNEIAKNFFLKMNSRRTVRHFTREKINKKDLEYCIRAAGTAPSGANKQPWFFAIVTDEKIKSQIRQAAEKEEKSFYEKRASSDFLKDLSPFKTNWQKPHLEEAAALIIIFSKSKNQIDSNEFERTYYARESTGIATGLLITALHQLGISTLTHTPNPMLFLNEILGRPKWEKPFLILAAGYQDRSIELPNIERKSFSDISTFY